MYVVVVINTDAPETQMTIHQSIDWTPRRVKKREELNIRF